MKTAYDRITIEPFDDTFFEGFAVYGHGTYGANSVLEGQTFRTQIDLGDTLEAIQAMYPGAETLDHNTAPFRFGDESLADLSGLPTSPPDWFDPGDAGERWDDDY